MHKPLRFSAGIHLHDDHDHYDEVGGEVNFVVDLKHGDAQAQQQNRDDDLDRLKCRTEEIRLESSRPVIRSTQSRAAEKNSHWTITTRALRSDSCIFPDV